MNSNSICR